MSATANGQADAAECSSSSSSSSSSAPPTLDQLLERCTTLISELEDFKQYLKGRRQEHTVEIAHFRNTVKSELRTLQRLCDVDHDQTRQVSQHTVNSSNLPFLESVWNTVKDTTGLQALQKRFFWHPRPDAAAPATAAAAAAAAALDGGTARPPGRRKQSALVDIVTQDGLEWIKVSLITNTRLLFDKAKQGWEDGPSSSEDDGSDNDDNNDADQRAHSQNRDGDGSEPDSQVPLVRMARDLFKAAATVRIRTKQPRIRLVLPKIEEGQIKEIDAIIASLRAMGASVECSGQTPPSRPLHLVLDRLLSDPFAALTPTVNIDCTILLALVSDFSHCAVDAEPWFHRALKRQVEVEDKENLLPSLLYPALAGRDLVCTRAAAKRMREIVATIGTPGEKARTALLMGDGDGDGNSGGDDAAVLRARLQDWTRFQVPEDLRPPIRVVEVVTGDSGGDDGDDNNHGKGSGRRQLPPAANMVRRSLSDINQSVFLYGWSSGCSTITSNRTVVKQIENLLNQHADTEADWPNIWLCPTARSLVGKEKGRRE
ncbi:hypothetical protein MBLNU459_g4749t1 [Dothideomycetes sp. NU459]